jgi:PIN domain nuclease of toxin-antitoxin system
MKLLLDTHILLWAAAGSPRLSPSATALIEAPETLISFSVASLWEIAINNSLSRADFNVDVHTLRELALANGYQELPITIDHIGDLASLPLLHKDPFDRMLIVQARRENMVLMTSDAVVASYSAGIMRG